MAMASPSLGGCRVLGFFCILGALGAFDIFHNFGALGFGALDFAGFSLC
jgi:hypothetical protein